MSSSRPARSGWVVPNGWSRCWAGWPPGTPQALRDRTLAEQEQISASAFAARVAAEQARWNSEARFEAVFAESVIGIGVGDIDGTILEVNRALCDMLGYSRRGVPADARSGSSSTPTTPPGVWEQVEELMAGALDHVRFEKAYYRKDGAEIWTHLVLSLVRDHQGRPRFVVAMVENITERHHLQTRLAHQALHDPLTGLPNRTLFFERLDARSRPGGPDTGVGVCYLDLDGFKAVNDTPRPRRRRRAAARGRPAAGRRTRPRRSPGRPDGRRRVRRAGRAQPRASSICERVAQAGAGNGPPPGRCSTATGSSSRPASASCSTRRRQHRRRRADAGRRHHDVLGQGRRPGPLRAVRRRTPPRRRRRFALSAADARGAGRRASSWSTTSRWSGWPTQRMHRRRGAGALAAARRRAAATRAGSSRWPRRPA